MQKLLRTPQPDPARNPEATDPQVTQPPGTLDAANRTFVCAVLFVDIFEYSKKPVAEQFKLKEAFTASLSHAIEDIPLDNRIILDTGEGVAVNFLDEPEEALFVALKLFEGTDSLPEGRARVSLRVGINYGPVRLVRDAGGHLNIIGDGLNVAERVTSFAHTGQALVSRSYYEEITRRSADYERLFAYQGSRTDKHVREHEIYELAQPTGEALDLATRRHRKRPGGTPKTTHHATPSRRPRWLASRVLAYGVAALSATTLLVAAIVFETSEPPDTFLRRTPRPAALVQPRPAQPPPPPVVSEAPSVAPVTPEPTQPIKPPEARRNHEARKPPHHAAKPKVRARNDSVAPERTAPQARTSAKAPVAEERAPTTSPPSSPKAAAGATALISFAISPWGEVVIDGKSAGVSPPLTELELPPGHHRIEIRNSSFKPYLQTFELEPNQTVRIKYKFKEG